MKEIIVYTSNFCGYCGAAKQWLQNNELDFTEINLDKGNEREKFMEKYLIYEHLLRYFVMGKILVGSPDLIDEDPNNLR